MSRPTIGSLCSGYGGLDMAAEMLTGGETVWVSDVDKGANKILAHRYPDVPNLGDFTVMDWSTVEPIDVLTAGYPCFVAGTPVLTKRGSVAIEDVVVGDEVWTHRNRWQRVTDTMSRTCETVRIGPIITTPDHPFYTRPLVRKWNTEVRHYRTELGGEADWTPAAKAQGQALATPLTIEGDTAPLLCDPWLAGRYVADGWAGRRQVFIAVGDGKAEEFESEAGGLGWTANPSGKSCVRYTLSDLALSEWLPEHFGKGAANKTIPLFVLTADRATRERFLAGYLSGDGHHQGAGKWRANTVSANLASQLRLLAIGLGYTSHILLNKKARTTVIEGRTVNQRDYWSVSMAPNDHRYTFDAHGMHWFKQRKPVEEQGEATVYDLTVENDHSFLAWGYVVHNCQPFSHAGKRAGTNDPRHLWPEVLRCLTELRPPFALFENVRGHLSLGFDQVLADLATHDYDARWIVLRAADIGAPHGRARLFILAADARRGGDRWDLVGAGRGAVRVGGVRGEGTAGGADEGRADLLGGRLMPTPRASDGEKGGPNQRGSSGDLMLPSAVAQLLPTPVASEGTKPSNTMGVERRKATGEVFLTNVIVSMCGLDPTETPLLPTPAVNDMGAAYTPETWDAWTEKMKAEHGNGNGHGKSLSIEAQRLLPTPRTQNNENRQSEGYGGEDGNFYGLLQNPERWGDYAPAIHRWEQILGRPAPAPTMTSAKGNPQLSPRFVEWMMGLPEGWVDDVPDLTRNEKLKALGNGVVSQQAVEAVVRLLALGSEVAA